MPAAQPSAMDSAPTRVPVTASCSQWAPLPPRHRLHGWKSLARKNSLVSKRSTKAVAAERANQREPHSSNTQYKRLEGPRGDTAQDSNGWCLQRMVICLGGAVAAACVTSGPVLASSSTTMAKQSERSIAVPREWLEDFLVDEMKNRMKEMSDEELTSLLQGVLREKGSMVPAVRTAPALRDSSKQEQAPELSWWQKAAKQRKEGPIRLGLSPWSQLLTSQRPDGSAAPSEGQEQQRSSATAAFDSLPPATSKFPEPRASDLPSSTPAAAKEAALAAESSQKLSTPPAGLLRGEPAGNPAPSDTPLASASPALSGQGSQAQQIPEASTALPSAEPPLEPAVRTPGFESLSAYREGDESEGGARPQASHNAALEAERRLAVVGAGRREQEAAAALPAQPPSDEGSPAGLAATEKLESNGSQVPSTAQPVEEEDLTSALFDNYAASLAGKEADLRPEDPGQPNPLQKLTTAGGAGLQAAETGRAWLASKLQQPAAPQVAAAGAAVLRWGPPAAVLALTAVLIKSILGAVLGGGPPAGAEEGDSQEEKQQQQQPSSAAPDAGESWELSQQRAASTGAGAKGEQPAASGPGLLGRLQQQAMSSFMGLTQKPAPEAAQRSSGGLSEAEAVATAARQILAAEQRRPPTVVGPPPLPPGAPPAAMPPPPAAATRSQQPGVWERIGSASIAQPDATSSAPVGGVLWAREPLGEGFGDAGRASPSPAAAGGPAMAGAGGVLWVREEDEGTASPSGSEALSYEGGAVVAAAAQSSAGDVEGAPGVADGAPVLWRRSEEPVETADGSAMVKAVWRREGGQPVAGPASGTSAALQEDVLRSGAAATSTSKVGAESGAAGAASAGGVVPGGNAGDGAGGVGQKVRRSGRSRDPALFDNVEFSVAPFTEGEGLDWRRR